MLGKFKDICFNILMQAFKKKFIQNFTNAIILFGEWALMLTLIGLNVQFQWHWTLQLFSMIIIGTRVHALGILMHEASHYNLFTSKAANEWLVKFFISLPTLVSLEAYRKTHELHHDYSQTEKDPTYTRKLGKSLFVFPKKSNWHFAKELLFIVLGYGAYMALSDLRRNQKNKEKKDRAFLALTLVFYVTLTVFLIQTQSVLIFFKFWLLPNMTVLPLVNYWRTITEHSCLPTYTNHTALAASPSAIDAISTPPLPNDFAANVRTVFYNPVLSWLITPYNINLHTEHHNRPNVKWYDLEKIYQKEKEHSGGHYTYGLSKLWKEFIA